jgi:hypothetical protein
VPEPVGEPVGELLSSQSNHVEGKLLGLWGAGEFDLFPESSFLLSGFRYAQDLRI